MQASEEQNRQRDQKLRNIIGDEIDRSERPDFFSEAVVDHDKIAYHKEKSADEKEDRCHMRAEPEEQGSGAGKHGDNDDKIHITEDFEPLARRL